jgi:hypothetical protein
MESIVMKKTAFLSTTYQSTEEERIVEKEKSYSQGEKKDCELKEPVRTKLSY